MIELAAFPRSTGRPRGERGSVTLFSVVFTFALLLLVGMVVDLGAKLRAGREAVNIAQDAARAGAGQVDRDRAYARGQFVISRSAAVRQAESYLARTGHNGTVSVEGTRRIQVTVHVNKPTVMLALMGITSVEATGTASADLVSGVEGPDT